MNHQSANGNFALYILIITIAFGALVVYGNYVEAKKKKKGDDVD